MLEILIVLLVMDDKSLKKLDKMMNKMLKQKKSPIYDGEYYC